MGKYTFFEPDDKLCAIHGNKAYFFKYKGLKCQVLDERKQFPVYLYISQYSLNFLYHNGKGDIHQHNYLFEISLGNIDEGLNEAYRGDIALCKDTLLNETIEHVYLRRRNEVRQELSFSDLKLFSMEYPLDFLEKDHSNKKLVNDIQEGTYIKRIIDTRKAGTSSPDKVWEKYSYPLSRKILLDFMFEFEINNTFKDLPYYYQLKANLHSNYTYKALYVKLKYYYLRTIVENNIDSGIALRKLEELVDIKKEWINIITNPASEYLFHHSKWFDDVETEGINIYNPSKNKVHKLIDRAKKKETEYRKTLCKKFEKTDVKYFRELFDKDNESSTFLYDRLLQKYNVPSVLMLDIGVRQCFSTWILIITIVALVLIHFFSPILADKILIYIAALPILAIMISIIRTFVAKAPSLNLNMLYPRLFFAISSAWIVVGLNADLFRTFALTKFDSSYHFVGILMIIVMLLFIYREVRKLNAFLSKLKCLERTAIIFSLGFLYSFLVGIMMFSFVGKGFVMNDEILLENFYKSKLADPAFIVKHDDPSKGWFLHDMIQTNKGRDSITMKINNKWEGLRQIYTQSRSAEYPICATLFYIEGKPVIIYFPILLYMLIFLTMIIGVFFELLANDRHMTDPM